MRLLSRVRLENAFHTCADVFCSLLSWGGIKWQQTNVYAKPMRSLLADPRGRKKVELDSSDASCYRNSRQTLQFPGSSSSRFLFFPPSTFNEVVSKTPWHNTNTSGFIRLSVCTYLVHPSRLNNVSESPLENLIKITKLKS